MKKRLILAITVLIVICLVLFFYFQKTPRPDFTLELNDRIFVEYNPETSTTGYESFVINFEISELPDDISYTFDINTANKSFNYIERATELGWDEEGREIVPGYTSVGAVTAFYYTVPGNKGLYDALLNGDPSRGVEPVLLQKGTLTVRLVSTKKTLNLNIL